MGILRIELLEDCEMNSDRVVNTYFADDVFFDGFGLPYIPAWIVRNSFVKAMEDVPSLFDEEDVESLVGRHADLILDDAQIAGRESMRQAILSNKFGGVLLRNPQTVLNASGFVKVKENSSIAKDHYVRVLASGAIFEAYFEIDDAHVQAFRRLVKQTTSLYVGHKVRVLLTIDEGWERPCYLFDDPQVEFAGDRCRLEYDLYLISHKTALNHISGEMDANPYITGAELRDALMVRDELADIFNKGQAGVNFSYAYVAVQGGRGIPIPASYSTKKQDKNDLRDRCSVGRRPDDYDQIKGVGKLFIDDPDGEHIHAMGVRKEQAFVRYYKDGGFHDNPFCAIGQGQTCKGFIEGSTDDVRRIYESLIADGYVRVGHLSNLGFGNAYVQVTSVKPLAAKEPVYAEEITVLLVSPARIYEGLLYEPSAQSVLNEVQSRLGGVELEIVRNSQKTCQVAVYNRAWHELEPLEYAMQEGSIYRMRAKDGSAFDVSPVMGGIFIGGHNDVGYGETLVLPAVDAYYRRISYGDLSEGDFPLSYKVDPNPGRRLMRSLYQQNANALASYMGAAAAEDYVRDVFRSGPLEEIKATIGDDFDRVQVFEAYMDALREAGRALVRRSHRD